MNFRQLHQGPDLLKIANVWDAGSAVLVQALGVPALATTSAGLAWALGYADGNHLPVAEHAAAVRRIARVAQAIGDRFGVGAIDTLIQAHVVIVGR